MTQTNDQPQPASAAPVQQPVRPDAFRDWFASLSEEERYNFDSDGRAYKKDAGQMMRMAWNAAAAAERERCARVALEQTTHPEDPNNEVWQCAYNHVANQIADAIRKA